MKKDISSELIVQLNAFPEGLKSAVEMLNREMLTSEEIDPYEISSMMHNIFMLCSTMQTVADDISKLGYLNSPYEDTYWTTFEGKKVLKSSLIRKVHTVSEYEYADGSDFSVNKTVKYDNTGERVIEES